jgi:hypothetical protein
MLELLENLVSILTNDATLNAIVPVSNVFTGPVDFITESQAMLLFPQIQLSVVSEITRSVPTNTRDTLVQISIFSRNSQLEVLNIYERILSLLEYSNTTIDATAVIFWQKVSSATDLYESDRRIWHRAVTVQAWSQKPFTSI